MDPATIMILKVVKVRDPWSGLNIVGYLPSRSDNITPRLNCRCEMLLIMSNKQQYYYVIIVVNDSGGKKNTNRNHKSEKIINANSFYSTFLSDYCIK